MRELGNLLADRIYQALAKVENLNELKEFESEMRDPAFEHNEKQGHPEFIEKDYDGIISRIDDGEKGQFLRKFSEMYFALIQKFIRVRWSELGKTL